MKPTGPDSAQVESYKPAQKQLQTGGISGHFRELMSVANTLAQSSLVPTSYRGKPQDTFVALQMGHELGMQPMASLNNIYVVNGRPTLSSQVMLGLAKSRPDYAGMKMIDSSTQKVSLEISRVLPGGGVETQRGEFTYAEAEKAKLTGKDNWRNYPRNMLEARAISFALRKLYPDLFAGIYSKEEVQDFSGGVNDEPAKPVDIKPAPKQEAKPVEPVQTEKPVKPASAPEKDIEFYLDKHSDKPEKKFILDWVAIQNEAEQKRAFEILVKIDNAEDNQTRLHGFLELYAMHKAVQFYTLDDDTPFIDTIESVMQSTDVKEIYAKLIECKEIIEGVING